MKLLPETTEMAIKMLKDAFQERLSKTLNLRRVTAPLFVLSGTGLNDDLNGSERAVSFPIADMGGRQAEVVHSLAKWKRVKLGAYDIAASSMGGSEGKASRAYKGVNINKEMKVEVSDTARSLSKGSPRWENSRSTGRKLSWSSIEEELPGYRSTLIPQHTDTAAHSGTTAMDDPHEHRRS